MKGLLFLVLLALGAARIPSASTDFTGTYASTFAQCSGGHWNSGFFQDAVVTAQASPSATTFEASVNLTLFGREIMVLARGGIFWPAGNLALSGTVANFNFFECVGVVRWAGPALGITAACVTSGAVQHCDVTYSCVDGPCSQAFQDSTSSSSNAKVLTQPSRVATPVNIIPSLDGTWRAVSGHLIPANMLYGPNIWQDASVTSHAAPYGFVVKMQALVLGLFQVGVQGFINTTSTAAQLNSTPLTTDFWGPFQCQGALNPAQPRLSISLVCVSTAPSPIRANWTVATTYMCSSGPCAAYRMAYNNGFRR
jgi:hypothetical protein